MKEVGVSGGINQCGGQGRVSEDGTDRRHNTSDTQKNVIAAECTADDVYSCDDYS